MEKPIIDKHTTVKGNGCAKCNFPISEWDLQLLECYVGLCDKCFRNLIAQGVEALAKESLKDGE
jgi:hypothetical protein